MVMYHLNLLERFQTVYPNTRTNTIYIWIGFMWAILVANLYKNDVTVLMSSRNLWLEYIVKENSNLYVSRFFSYIEVENVWIAKN